MKNRLINRANRHTSFSMAAVLISVSYLASRVLGLLRDRLLASHFGIGPLTDAYSAAFRLPDLLFTLLVSGAFAVAFIPVLTEHWVSDDKKAAWELSSSILNLLVLFNIIAAIFLYIWAGPLTHLLTPGFDPYRHDLTVHLTRIMLITPCLFAASSVFGAIQQTFNRFVFYAVSSVFYNVGIIFGIVFLSHKYSIEGVAYGVVIGAFIQAAIQILGLIGLGYRYRFRFNLRLPAVRRVFKLMIPRSIDQGVDQLNYVVETVVGSRLAAGSLTAYYYANNLKYVPLAIFGSAISTAAFPGLSARAAKGDTRGLIGDFISNARLILFLVVPAAVIAVLMRGYIVRLLFGFGNATTAQILGWFSGVIIFQSLLFLIGRVFYALQDTKTPLIASVISIVFNIIFSVILSRIYGVVGLAMSASLVSIIETVFLLSILKRRLRHIGLYRIGRGLAPVVVATFVMAVLIYALVSRALPLQATDRGFLVVGPKFTLIGLGGVLTYVGLCYGMALPEAKLFIDRVRSKLWQPNSPYE